jgi:catechol 2,3-dioxygenase-like lactoylglutathione lyase family enzyme/predicted RNA-binding protein with PIN domain
VAEPTLYLFDGHNLLHAGDFRDQRELRDALASFVALRGARGILVFDGVGVDESHGALDVRYAPDADTLLERLAAENRGTHEVCLVSSDSVVRGTSGLEVQKRSSQAFLADLEPAAHSEQKPGQLRDLLDAETRDRLEQLRRGETSPTEDRPMKQHVSIITLGVRDLARARRFYGEVLGWAVTAEEHDWVSFKLGNGSSALALYPWDGLAEDAGVDPGGAGFRGVTLAYGVGSPERVDEVLAEVARAGATVVKPAQPTPWGGYNGYFADPDGHLWEVVKLDNYRAE